jgi:hypothetical protein
MAPGVRATAGNTGISGSGNPGVILPQDSKMLQHLFKQGSFQGTQTWNSGTQTETACFSLIRTQSSEKNIHNFSSISCYYISREDKITAHAENRGKGETP